MILTALMLLQSAAAIDCEDAMTQADMNWCAAQDYNRADEALNRQWSATAAEMKRRDARGPDDGRPGYFQTLLEAQRAWLTYRDAHCRSEGFYARGGSLEPLLVATCKTDLTEARTEQLASLAEDI